ncbi:MAG: hypothetical protein ACI88A_000005 [Paraglaciecola sp.]|jgi:hypothetical protein
MLRLRSMPRAQLAKFLDEKGLPLIVPLPTASTSRTIDTHNIIVANFSASRAGEIPSFFDSGSVRAKLSSSIPRSK